MRILITFTILWFSVSLFAQYTFKGKVQNTKNENLEFAVVFLENTEFAAVTNDKGIFEISDIPKGTYTVKISHTSYKNQRVTVDIHQDAEINFILEILIFPLDNIDIIANRLQKNDPFRIENVDKSYFDKINLGADIPALLQFNPSMLMTSDAGNSIGYSSLSIRGSDQTRINVAINGVPVNDAESQNVFWVNMPDLIGSTQNIQIQRGVGASTNGPGAFGGTISMDTRNFMNNPHLHIGGSGGSFGSYKGHVSIGTGLMNGKYSIDGRYSYIKSDGFIDRAKSNLHGIYFSAGKISEKSSLKLQIISGRENTYQAWNGVPESRYNNDENELLNHYTRNQGSLYHSPEDSVNLFNSDQRYNYYRYENQVDNYRQTQSQLSYQVVLKPKLFLESTIFHTFGSGYFEQFRFQDDFGDYGFFNVSDLDGNVISNADLVRRRWLKNHFYGLTSNIKGITKNNAAWQAGIFGSFYDGDHFGEIIKTTIETQTNIWSPYYDNTGKKMDLSTYFRYQTSLGEKFQLYGDIQVRYINYFVNGILDDQQKVDISSKFTFLNPKAGITYHINPQNNLLLSFAVAHKEPARSDFLDHIGRMNTPKPERLFNYEFAYRLTKKDIIFHSGIYFMLYKNQLVLNGNLNDVGAPLRINVPKSYRLGWESEFTKDFNKRWQFAVNLTLSKNTIQDFNETLFDYTHGQETVINQLGDSPISYSPNLVSSIRLLYKPFNNWEIEWFGKYVSKQYLDNTGNDNRSLPAFHVHNLRIHHKILPRFCKEALFTVMVNNILNRKYANNGYTYSYIYNQLITENFYFPQAGIHFMAGMEWKF